MIRDIWKKLIDILKLSINEEILLDEELENVMSKENIQIFKKKYRNV